MACLSWRQILLAEGADKAGVSSKASCGGHLHVMCSAFATYHLRGWLSDKNNRVT